MLQGLNLPFIDITTPENGVGIAMTTPAEGDMPVLRFADIFRLEPAALTGPVSDGGMSLPVPGKELPSAGADLSIESALPDEPLSPYWLGNLPANPLAPDTVSPSVLPTSIEPGKLSPAVLLPPATPMAERSTSTSGHTPFGNLLDAGTSLPRPPSDTAAAATTVTAAAPTTVAATAVATAAGSQPLALPVIAQSFSARGGSKPPVAMSDAAAVRAPIALDAVPAGDLRELNLSVADDQNRGQKPPTLATPFALRAPESPQAAAANTAEQSLLAQLSPSSPLQALQPVQVPARADSAAAVPAVLSQLATPVLDPAWGERVGDRLLMMAADKLQFAEIRLSPAELGPLRIRISIDDGAASVTFHAQHAITRDALEQAMPRLRELLADNGLTLAEGRIANSGEQGVPQGKPEQRAAAEQADRFAADGEDDATPGPVADRFRTRPDQLLDTFA